MRNMMTLQKLDDDAMPANYNPIAILPIHSQIPDAWSIIITFSLITFYLTKTRTELKNLEHYSQTTVSRGYKRKQKSLNELTSSTNT